MDHRRLLIAELRPRLEPLLESRGLTWEGVAAVVDKVGGLAELQAALDDPEAFVQKLLEMVGPAVIKLAIMKLRAKIEPLAAEQGLAWEDVLPVLETVDSVEELRVALDDPEGLVQTLLSGTDPPGVVPSGQSPDV